MNKNNQKVKILTKLLEKETKKKVVLKEEPTLIGSDTFYFPPKDPNAKIIIDKFIGFAKETGAIDCKIINTKKLSSDKSEIWDVAVAFKLADKVNFKTLQKKSHNMWRTLEKKNRLYFHSGLENLNFIKKTYDLKKLKSIYTDNLALQKIEIS